MSKLDIYTDGGSRNNGKSNALGGWGFVHVSNGKLLCSDKGSDPQFTTNNQNEIYSVIEGLSIVAYPEADVEVFSDSAYLVNCINDKWYVNWRKNGWVNSKKSPVANKELWENLLSQIERIESYGDTKITFTKVKGHSGNEWNEYADTLVNEAMDEMEYGE